MMFPQPLEKVLKAKIHALYHKTGGFFVINFKEKPPVGIRKGSFHFSGKDHAGRHLQDEDALRVL